MFYKIIGFTGTRNGMTDYQIKSFRRTIAESKLGEFHHGDCVGADAEAHRLIRAWSLDIWIVKHPPLNNQWQAYCLADEMCEPKEYIERNHNIVDACNLLIACPQQKEETLRSGTWATVRYARQKKHKILVIIPSGVAIAEGGKKS